MAGENLAAIFGGNIISKSTPHLYISALAASSRDSNLMTRWHAKFPHIPLVVSSSGSGALLVQLQQDEKVRSVAFSPEGTRLLTLSWDGVARLLDVATGWQILKLDGRVKSVGFSPDGAQVIAGSHIITAWDTSTGMKLYHLDGHNRDVTSIDFFLDGARIVSGSSDGMICIWDTSTGKHLLSLDGHDIDEEVTSICSSSDGTHVASGSERGIVRIWDISSGKPLYQLLHEKDCPVHSVIFSSDMVKAHS